MSSGVSALVSNIAGYAVGLLISFSLSKVFVFESKRRTGPELRRFLFSFLVSFLLNLAVLTVLTESWAGVCIRRAIRGDIRLCAGDVLTQPMVGFQSGR